MEMVITNSKTHPYRKDPSRFIPVQVERVGREIHFLIGKTHQQSALDVDICLIDPRALAYQSKSKPIHR